MSCPTIEQPLSETEVALARSSQRRTLSPCLRLQAKEWMVRPRWRRRRPWRPPSLCCASSCRLWPRASCRWGSTTRAAPTLSPWSGRRWPTPSPTTPASPPASSGCISTTASSGYACRPFNSPWIVSVLLCLLGQIFWSCFSMVMDRIKGSCS
jgi:hypothetical protein